MSGSSSDRSGSRSRRTGALRHHASPAVRAAASHGRERRSAAAAFHLGYHTHFRLILHIVSYDVFPAIFSHNTPFIRFRQYIRIRVHSGNGGCCVSEDQPEIPGQSFCLKARRRFLNSGSPVTSQITLMLSGSAHSSSFLQYVKRIALSSENG